jgi:organic hydroperoxide reductase OsmC/OhrA
LKKQFRVQTQWSSNDVFSNAKTHSVSIENKQNLIVSAAKVFKGDETKYNPEDLFLSALSSCHMMSYMYLCEKHHITLVDYSDQTVGTLVVKADGSGSFTEITINPTVTILESDKLDLALRLHTEANRLCFIANSCSVPIQHKPIIQIAN